MGLQTQPGATRSSRDVVMAALVPIAVAVALLVLATVAAFALEQLLGVADASPVYLLAVVVVAGLFGAWPAVAVSVVAVLLYDFLFTVPRFTLVVADPQEWLSLLLFLAVAVVIGRLAALLRERADTADRRLLEALALVAISREIATAISVEDAAREIVEILCRDTEMRRVWITLDEAAGPDATPLADAGGPARGPFPEPWILLRRPGDEAAEWARVSTTTPVERPPSEDVAGMVLYAVPIETETGPLGCVWATRDLEDPRPGRGARRILAMAADQLGLALVGEQLRDEVTQTEIDRASDRLKGALLDSVSHDLRTPLSSIRAIAGILMDPEAEPGPSERRELAAAIDLEAARLGELVRSLLDVSRVQAGALRPTLELFELGELVDGTLSRAPLLAGRPIEVTLDDDLPLVLVDAVMFDSALANVLDNAARYAPPPAPIRITARAVSEADEARPGGGARSVCDRARPGGPGAVCRRRARRRRRRAGRPARGAAPAVRAVPSRTGRRRTGPPRPRRRHDDRARLPRGDGRDGRAGLVGSRRAGGQDRPESRGEPRASRARSRGRHAHRARVAAGGDAAWVSRSS